MALSNPLNHYISDESGHKFAIDPLVKWTLVTTLLLISNLASAQSANCVAQDISNAGEKTFVFYNALLSLASKSFPQSPDNFKSQWEKASEVAETNCQGTYPLTFIDAERTNANEFSVTLKAGKYTIGKKGSSTDYTFYISKQTGNYANQPFLIAHFENQNLDFVRITGRKNNEKSINMYNFVLSKNKPEQFLLNLDDFTDIKSLKTVYKNNIPKPHLDLPVGVIGTGVDYNHPKLAIQMAYRQEMENDVVQMEILKEKLRFKIYNTLESYLEDQNQYDTLVKTVGFPKWMDHAMNSTKPFDRILSDTPTSITQFHETLITSRIMMNAPNVKIYSVRRHMGLGHETLNVPNIIRRFYNAGVRIVNLSFGSSCGFNPDEERLWEQVFNMYPDMIFVAAAGNSNKNINEEPACPSYYSTKHKHVISVTAADLNGLSQYYGTYVNYGMNVDVAAIADNHEVYLPLNYGNKKYYEPAGASSIATAEVTRILVEAINQGLKVEPQKVKAQLIESSLKVPALYGKVKSGGIVDEVKFQDLLRLQQTIKVTEQIR